MTKEEEEGRPKEKRPRLKMAKYGGMSVKEIYMEALRDNLLVTAGARAAYMHCAGRIELPRGVEGEAEIAHFISTVVNRYIVFDQDENFDEYIELALTDKYRRTAN